VNSHFINGYIEIDPVPDPLIFSSGPDSVCHGTQNVLYTIIPIQNADSIIWEISPPEAGIISGTGDSIYVNFTPGFSGDVYISGYGINACGEGDQATYLTYVIGTPMPEAGPGSLICQNESYTLSGSATNYSISVWHTDGDGSFDDPFLLDAIYSPGEEDIKNGDVYLTLYCTAISPCVGVANDYLELIIKKNPDKPQIPVGPTSIILGANLTSDYYTHPADYSNEYQWHLIPLEAGTISGLDTAALVYWNQDFPGTSALINVEAINNCATISSDSLAVDINPVGYEENKLPEISISPNPSNGIIQVSIEGINQEIELSLISSRGDLIHTRKIKNNHPGYSFQFDFSQQPPGIYYLTLFWDEHIITEQIILNPK
jgi:hypothetical protein